MTASVEVKKEIKTDVLVVGGGTAGVFAAISAARSGADVVMVEKTALLGGTIISGGVNFPGIFHAWGRQIIDGPGYESIRRAAALGGASIPDMRKDLSKKHYEFQIFLDPFIYLTVLREMCRECGVNVQLHTMLITAKETAGGAEALFAQKDGVLRVIANTLIDCTGDADAVFAAGFATKKSEVLQPATLEAFLTGYEKDGFSREDVTEAYTCALETGSLKQSDFGLAEPLSVLLGGKTYMHVPCASPETSEGKTRLEEDAGETLARQLRFFHTVKGLEKIRVSRFAPETGVRESRRIVARTTVTEQEYLAGKVYPDAVCYAFYPIDRHVADGLHKIDLSEDVVPTVPYSCLMPAKAKHFLAAGRCAGADTEANSALRVQAVCMAMGQAAGVAGAIAAQTGGSTEVSLTELRAGLQRLGAVVPPLP